MLFGMLAVNVLVLAGLIWQIHQNQQRQQTTVAAVLNDYAAMAAQRLARILKGQVGYATMYQLSQMWATANDPSDTIRQYLNTAASEFDANHQTAKQAISNIQLIHIPSGRISALDHPGLTARTEAMPNLETGQSYAFKALHNNLDSLAFQTLIKLNPDYAVLVDFTADLLPTALQHNLQKQTLLPSVLIERPDNQGLGFALSSPSGRSLWQTDPYQLSDNQHTLLLDADYGGLFAAYRLTAVIDPQLAAQLIIGGLPKSQLPMLLTLALLAVVALLSLVWLLYRTTRLNHWREQFIARASHELKTPLTQIRLYTESWLLGRLPAAEQQQHALHVINQESIRLAQLVDNILQLNQLNQGTSQIQSQSFQLAPFIAQLIDQQRILWQDRTIQVDINIPADWVLVTDPDLFKQVLLNLLDNAVKFGPNSQTLRLEATTTERTTRLAISDQGPGIPEAQIQRLLQPHQRLNRDEQRGINGNGLGLGIASQLLEQLGGQLLFEHPDVGLTVVIELPNWAAANPSEVSS